MAEEVKDLDKELEQPKTEGPKKTFKGSCTCGKVSYKVDLALSDPPGFQRCNCTVCQKRSWATLGMAETDFHLQTPCSTSELFASKHLEHVGVYVREKTSPGIKRFFCDVCGSPFAMHGHFMLGEKRVDFFCINPSTLEQPQEGLDLSTFKIQYWNGLVNDFGAKQDHPYPGGLC